MVTRYTRLKGGYYLYLKKKKTDARQRLKYSKAGGKVMERSRCIQNLRRCWWQRQNKDRVDFIYSG